MNKMSLLYSFLAGPCLYITVPLCFSGLIRKMVILISGRRQGLRFPVSRTGKYISGEIKNNNPCAGIMTFIKGNSPLIFAGILFHLAIIAAPLTAAAHGILLDQAWHILPPEIDPLITDIFTFTAIAAGLFLLIRRTLVQHVLAVSSWRDYASMICVLTPFITGLLAREMKGPYDIIIITHCVAAHALLLAIGWTRLGHMVFFTAGRIAASGLTGRRTA